MPRRAWAVLSAASGAVSVAAAGLCGGLLLWALAPVPFGYRPNLVTSDSMSPLIDAGDVVLTRPIAPDRIRVGQVVLVDDPSRGAVLLHRVTSFSDGAIVTKGDANPTPDFPAATPPQIRGAGQLLVPRVGLAALVLGRHPGLLAALGCGLMVSISAWPRGGRGRGGGRRLARGPWPQVASVPADTEAMHVTRQAHGQAADDPRPRRRRGGLSVAFAIPITLGLLAASAVVWQTSQAAFTATTSNAANSWSTGTVALTDDDSAAAMFSATGLIPGSTGSKCITVTYGGSVTSAVKLYISANTGAALQAYLDVIIEEGTGGSFANCTGFSATSTLFTGTLATASTNNNSYATGWSSWSPTGAGQSRTYRIAYTLNASTPDAQQGANATATFQWEARTP